MKAGTQKSCLALHAASFALWAPIAALLLELAGNAALRWLHPAISENSIRLTKFLTIGIALLILAAVVMGVLALRGFRRHRTSGILVRSVPGLILSLSLLALGANTSVTLSVRAARMEGDLVGIWRAGERLPDGTPMTATLTLNTDRHGRLRLETRTHLFTLTGHWHVARGDLALLLDPDPGQTQELGNSVLWRIGGVTDSEATLVGKESGQEVSTVFHRIAQPPTD